MLSSGGDLAVARPGAWCGGDGERRYPFPIALRDERFVILVEVNESPPTGVDDVEPRSLRGGPDPGQDGPQLFHSAPVDVRERSLARR